jgi:hypothetical protein
MSNPSPSELKFRREWAKLVGKRRLDAFERALTDPDLVSLKQELIKVDLRIADLEERAAEGESREGWEGVVSLAKLIDSELNINGALPDLDKLRDYAARLRGITEQGEQDWRTWDEVTKLIELRRKLSDTERKFEELRNYKVPATEVLRLLDDLHAAIEAVVSDRQTRFSIFHEVRLRANGESSARARVPVALPTAYLASASPDAVADAESEAMEGE